MKKLLFIFAMLLFLTSHQVAWSQKSKVRFLRPKSVYNMPCYKVGTLIVQPPDDPAWAGRLYRVKSRHYKPDGKLEGCVFEPVDKNGDVVPIKDRAKIHPSVRDLN